MPTAKEIADFLKKELGDVHTEIHGVSSIDNLKPNTVIFVREYSDTKASKLNAFQNILAIVTEEYRSALSSPFVVSDNPKLDFSRVVAAFFLKKKISGIASSSSIGKNAVLGSNICIGENCVIGTNVQIGSDTIVFNGVVIADNSIIGSNVLIKSNAVIGEEGFGFAFDSAMNPFRVPHLGAVIIGDNVEIGCFTTVCKGTIDNTVIENYVKIDDHVHIAHNVTIGEKTIITACAEISGSTRIGKGVWISPNASIIDQIIVEDFALIGIGAVVISNVPANAVYVGNPAKYKRERYSTLPF
jgi:UDP-3-O-[3-hydroxymyristoyl] glucosamine N-acyltransferase